MLGGMRMCEDVQEERGVKIKGRKKICKREGWWDVHEMGVKYEDVYACAGTRLWCVELRADG